MKAFENGVMSEYEISYRFSGGEGKFYVYAYNEEVAKAYFEVLSERKFEVLYVHRSKRMTTEEARAYLALECATLSNSKEKELRSGEIFGEHLNDLEKSIKSVADSVKKFIEESPSPFKPTAQMIAEAGCDGKCLGCEGLYDCWKVEQE